MVSLKTLKVGFYLMNFLKNLATTTAVSVAFLGTATLIQTQQAQAFTIVAGDLLNLNGGSGGVKVNAVSTPPIDFFDAAVNLPTGSVAVVKGGASTGQFATLGGAGRISDLTLSDVMSGTKSGFLQLFVGASPDFANDVYFNITQILGGGIAPTPGPLDVVYASFKGNFVNAVGDILGDGNASIQLRDSTMAGSSSWSMTILAQKTPIIPTPALIPGIAAMGMGLLRRKKAQAVAA
jgi:hypothetical protein